MAKFSKLGKPLCSHRGCRCLAVYRLPQENAQGKVWYWYVCSWHSPNYRNVPFERVPVRISADA